MPEVSELLDKLTNTSVPAAILVFAIAVALVVLFFKATLSEGKDSQPKRPAGMPRIPASMQRAPPQKVGGSRATDSGKTDEASQKVRRSAVRLAEAKKFLEAAKLLEQSGLLRDAVDLLEANKLFDDAASMLMTINRPNRAAVIYERNQVFDKAALFYLRAKLTEDAKRCMKQIKQLNSNLIAELAVLFAEAGDKLSALSLSIKLNNQDKTLKLLRDSFAYNELAQLLDNNNVRDFILASLSIADISHMLENMPEDDSPPIHRILLWLNESQKGEWLVPAFRYIGDQRGLAAIFAEKIDHSVIEAFTHYSHRLGPEYVSKHIEPLEWTARALHDASHWGAAARVFELLGSVLLAAKARALSGDLESARQLLRLPKGDGQLAIQLDAAVTHLGANRKVGNPLSKDERELLQRVFFSIDPDNEKKRTDSPFHFAS